MDNAPGVTHTGVLYGAEKIRFIYKSSCQFISY